MTTHIYNLIYYKKRKFSILSEPKKKCNFVTDAYVSPLSQVFFVANGR